MTKEAVMETPKWTRAERGGGRICEVCKQAISRRTPAMRRDEETSDFRGDDIVTFRHLHCHQTRALSDKVWAERGGPALTRQRDEASSQRDSLLARIHGDGGHYITQYGLEKAIEDAHEVSATRTAKLDEAWELLEEAQAWLSLCAHRLATETPKVGEPSRSEILAMCTKIAAALRRGEGK